MKDGKGYLKEYNYYGELEFEGEYFNGKKNGKGKEYYNNKNLKFEGEYSNGKRNGKGKEYNYNGLLIYEGEYSDDINNGKGKEYDYNNGKIIFEGDYLYSRKIKGKDFIEGKLAYEGDYLYDKKYNGKGYDNNGNIIYELINGNGQVHEYYKFNDSDKIEYIGEYKNGIKNGKGKEYNKNGKLIFEGEYLNGIKWNGKIYDLNSNNIYELKNGTGFVK